MLGARSPELFPLLKASLQLLELHSALECSSWGWKSWEGLEPAGGSSLLLNRRKRFCPKLAKPGTTGSLVLQESRAGSLQIPLPAMPGTSQMFVPCPHIPEAVLPLGEQLQSFSPAPGLQHQGHEGAGAVPNPPAFPRDIFLLLCGRCRVLPAPAPLLLLLQPRPCKERVAGDTVSPAGLSRGQGPAATSPAGTEGIQERSSSREPAARGGLKLSGQRGGAGSCGRADTGLTCPKPGSSLGLATGCGPRGGRRPRRAEERPER